MQAFKVDKIDHHALVWLKRRLEENNARLTQWNYITATFRLVYSVCQQTGKANKNAHALYNCHTPPPFSYVELV